MRLEGAARGAARGAAWDVALVVRPTGDEITFPSHILPNAFPLDGQTMPAGVRTVRVLISGSRVRRVNGMPMLMSHVFITLMYMNPSACDTVCHASESIYIGRWYVS
jgi:hypothetical protein